MTRHLENWRSVWSCYRGGRRLPPLRLRNGLEMHFGTHDDPISLLHEIFAEGHYRYGLGSSPGLMIDIGANIGANVLDMAGRFPELQIQAYEPNPETYESLKRNVGINGLTGRVHLYQEAVGSHPGTLRLWQNGSSVMTTAYRAPFQTMDVDTVDVPMIDLNVVMQRARAHGEPIDLLKIDAEGAEVDILAGATPGCLRACRRICIEYHNHLVANARQHCCAILRRAGFRVTFRPATKDVGLLDAWQDGSGLGH